MKTDNTKKSSGFFRKLREKISGDRGVEQKESTQTMSDDRRQLMEDFEVVISESGQITGSDFERAFDFIDKYPATPEAEILIAQMYSTTPQTLKGLSYSSALKVLDETG